MYVSDFVSDKCSFFQSYFCDFLCEGVFSGFRTTSSGFYVAVLLFLLTNHITSDHNMDKEAVLQDSAKLVVFLRSHTPGGHF